MNRSPLQALCAEVGLELPRLQQARDDTLRRLAVRAELLEAAGLPPDIAVVFVGSWGRHEVTTGSDNDFYVLTGASGDASAAIVERVKALLRDEDAAFREPGREGVFGEDVVSLQSLIENIGLDRDTNTNLTQRMLLVLESAAAFNADLHVRARGEVLSTYLEPPIKACQPPRLFLNDVVRYWRTMCVDFAGKMRDRRNQGWGLRNAKLRTTRKMLFASGLLPLMRCGQLGSDEIPTFLAHQFAMPPTDRVADAFLACGRQREGARVFSGYEGFLDHIRSEETRDALNDIKGRAEADRSELFQSIVPLGNEIEAGLLHLLFDSELSDTTRRYGIF